jgi:hypothetical protein
LTEKALCSAASCRNDSVGTIDRYGNSPYCYPHLMALASMNENRRPKPVISFFPGFTAPISEPEDKPTPIMRIDRVRTFEQAEQKIRNLSIVPIVPETKVADSPSKPIAQTKAPKKVKWGYYVLILVVVGTFMNWSKTDQEQKSAVAELEARNLMAAKCFQIAEENKVARAGNVGSKSRQNAVVSYFEEIAKSPCVEWGDGSLYENPFFGVNNKSSNWKQFENSFRYTLERWNGIERFSLRCADGWQSQSIGKQGACSHHGGVVSGFNEIEAWSLTNQFGSADSLFPPLAELEARAS